MVLAVEITLLVALLGTCALLWRLIQRIDASVISLYKLHKALAKDCQRTQLTADQMLQHSLSLHESNQRVLSDPRVQRILNRAE